VPGAREFFSGLRFLPTRDCIFLQVSDFASGIANFSDFPNNLFQPFLTEASIPLFHSGACGSIPAKDKFPFGNHSIP
jgi:hypothetical protein